MVVVPDRFPMLCYPALELQDRMRRMTLGALGTVLWLLPIALRVKLTKQSTWVLDRRRHLEGDPRAHSQRPGAPRVPS